MTALEQADAPGRVMRWSGISGRRYRMSWMTNLAVSPSDSFMSLGVTNAWSDESLPLPPVRLYRVGVDVPPMIVLNC